MLTWNRAIFSSLLIIHSALLAYGAWVHSPTYNEPAHLAAGVSYWQYNRFDIYNVNPPLVKLVAAIPVLIVGCETNWDHFSDAPGRRVEMTIGRDFSKANGVRFLWLITIARWSCIPFSLLGAVVCYRWSSELYGPWSGIFAMSLWCFCPNVIAHGQLITSDIASASLAALACYTYWNWLKKPSWWNTILSGLALGIAESAKTTLLIFYPLWPILWLLYRIPDRHRFTVRDWFREAGLLACRMLLSIYVLNLVYAFEGTMTPLKDFHFVSRLFTGIPDPDNKIPNSSGAPLAPYSGRGVGGEGYSHDNNRFINNWLGDLPVPFPKHYILGIDAQRNDFDKYHNDFYLGGQWSKTGWWYYYLYAAAIKIPLGTLLLLLLAGIMCVCSLISRCVGAHRRRCESDEVNASSPMNFSRIQFRDELFLVAPAITISVFVSSQTGINEHFRYILPCFPFLYIWLSRSIRNNPKLVFARPVEAKMIDREPMALATGSGNTGISTNYQTAAPASSTVPLTLSPSALGRDGQNAANLDPYSSHYNNLGLPAIRAIATILLAYSIASSLFVYPNSLSYFNELIGGPAHGSEHLIHSNIDWGQDLIYLKRWLDAHPDAEPFYLDYFGGFAPLDIGIEFKSIPRMSRKSNNNEPTILPAGWYAISVDHLIRATDPDNGNFVIASFNERQPIARAGWSINIYRLELDEQLNLD
ncbi:MAG: glycosyltransferase family 39 protein [Pirellulaceae bacterium]|nr:glycosyltransferase family 39 protein [Pirellulaceae bacterium]